LDTSIIRSGIEASVRVFKPKLALILASLSLNEDMTCADYANLLPDLNATVTFKEIE
jgi:hypothetical protein